MKRWLITMGGGDYDHITERVIANHPGVDEVYVYDDRWWWSHPFWDVPGNKWLREHHYPRGMGWYAWKPIMILDALDKMSPGDVVLYLDGDTYPIADLSPIYDHAAEHGAMFFAASAHNNRQWCTEQCLFVMGQDEPRYRDAQAGVARFMAVRKGGGIPRWIMSDGPWPFGGQPGPIDDWKERQFLYEWLSYATNRYATTFDPPAWISSRADSTGPEHSDFNQHRTEQAIMTNLCHKYGYPLHREACQAGNDFPDQPGDYPQLFVQVNQENQWRAPNNSGSKFRRIP